MGEWSLVIFTILMQTAIGAYLWATLMKSRKQERDFNKNNIAILALTAVAMIVSLMHLGTPSGALRALLNVKSSWLSREILFSGAFFGLVFITVLGDKLKLNGSQKVLLGWVTSVVGLLSVFSMSKLYMSSIIPAWNSRTTMLDFFVTTIVLGGIMLLVTSLKELEGEVAKLSIVMAAAVLIHAAVFPSFVAGLGAGTAAAQTSAMKLAQAYGGMLILRWVLVLGGVGLVILSQYKKQQESTYIYLALAALVLGQIAGRYIFFAVGVARGVGVI
ncbi:MAG: hypothetical protein VR72_12295 [Clostridiaceae bacterium BRH_c20a]|nr:MAG: hypothetical protein VR72_12295 [Clostridiaceae bacterium BRH_c20a]